MSQGSIVQELWDNLYTYFFTGKKNFRYTYIGKEIKTHLKSVHTKDPTQRLLQLRGPEN